MNIENIMNLFNQKTEEPTTTTEITTIEETEEHSMLDCEIAMVFNRLSDVEPYDDKYEVILKNLDRLYKLKAMENEEKRKEKRPEPKEKKEFLISPDLVFSSAVTVLTTAFVLHYEHLHPVTSKMFNKIIGGLPRLHA